MKKFLAFTQAMLLVCAVSLTGCGAEDEIIAPPLNTVSTSFNVQIGSQPTSLDPSFAFGIDEQTYLNHLYEGLVTLDENNQPQPGVASSWEKESSVAGVVTYIFTLDENALWSDGTQVSPYDFVYSWERTINPDNNSFMAHQLYSIKNASDINNGRVMFESILPLTEEEQLVTDPNADPDAFMVSLGLAVNEDANTLSVTLEGDSDSFLASLATPIFAPLQFRNDIYASSTWYNDGNTFVGNGPYVLSSWNADKNIVMDQNTNYSGSRSATHSQINFVLATPEQADSVYSDFQAGNLQVAKDFPLLEWEKLSSGEIEMSAKVQNVTVGGSANLLFNVSKSPFNDPNVNKTLSQSIQRDQLVALLGNTNQVATGLVPPKLRSDDVEYRSTVGDMSSVIYSSSPLSTLRGMTSFKLLTTDSPSHIKAAEYIVQQWQETFELTVSVDSVSWDTFVERLDTQSFDIAYFPMYTDSIAPHSFLDVWTIDNPLNFAGFQNPDYDNLIRQSHGLVVINTVTTDGDDSTDADIDIEETDDTTPVWQHLSQAESILVDDSAVIAPLLWYADNYALQSSVNTFTASPFGTLYFG